MINAKKVLAQLGLSTSSYLMALQQVREHVMASRDSIGAAKKLIASVADVSDVEFADIDEALTVAQAVVEFAVRHDEFDPMQAIENGRMRNRRLNESYPWARIARVGAPKNEVAVVEGIDVAVEVRADGKIKKGGKQILAAELFKKYVTEAASPLDNKQFVELLMKELGMSKSGATTYAWNCRKQAS